MILVESIEAIQTGRKYALIVGGYKIRELTGGSFQDRKIELVRVWIDSRILFDITPEDIYEPKVTDRR